VTSRARYGYVAHKRLPLVFGYSFDLLAAKFKQLRHIAHATKSENKLSHELEPYTQWLRFVLIDRQEVRIQFCYTVASSFSRDVQWSTLDNEFIC